MTYQDLIRGLKQYGASEEDICLRGIGVQASLVGEHVVIAPWWEPASLPDLGNATYLSKSESDSVKVWNIQNPDGDMTYIKTGIGAPVLMDVVLSLGVTKCKTILFVGSVGSLDPAIGIGDVVVPAYSICGDGASRYIAGNTLSEHDCFGEKVYPNESLFYQLKNAAKTVCAEQNVSLHIGKNFSIDTVMAQFAHIEEIVNMGCNVIEMETAAAFRVGTFASIATAALFSVSDNTVLRKSLISGRTKEEMEYRRFVRRTVFPQIIRKTFASC